MTGVAPEAYLYSCKAFDNCGSGALADIIAAIQWAIDNGMQVINMSFGGKDYSQSLNDICYAAYNAGIVLIASAGNNGKGRDTCGYPARFNACIGVAATDSKDSIASFSSEGPAVEVSAPGVKIKSTVPKSGDGNLVYKLYYRTWTDGWRLFTFVRNGIGNTTPGPHTYTINVKYILDYLTTHNLLDTNTKMIDNNWYVLGFECGNEVYNGTGKIEISELNINVNGNMLFI